MAIFLVINNKNGFNFERETLDYQNVTSIKKNRHDFQDNDIQHNGTQLNDLICDTQLK